MGQSQSQSAGKKRRREQSIQQLEAMLKKDPHVMAAVAACKREVMMKRSRCPEIVRRASSILPFFEDQTPEGKCHFIEGRESERFMLQKVVAKGWPAVHAEIQRNVANELRNENMHQCNVMGHRHHTKNPTIRKLSRKVTYR